MTLSSEWSHYQTFFVVVVLLLSTIVILVGGNKTSVTSNADNIKDDVIRYEELPSEEDVKIEPLQASSYTDLKTTNGSKTSTPFLLTSPDIIVASSKHIHESKISGSIDPSEHSMTSMEFDHSGVTQSSELHMTSFFYEDPSLKSSSNSSVVTSFLSSFLMIAERRNLEESRSIYLSSNFQNSVDSSMPMTELVADIKSKFNDAKILEYSYSTRTNEVFESDIVRNSSVRVNDQDTPNTGFWKANAMDENDNSKTAFNSSLMKEYGDTILNITQRNIDENSTNSHSPSPQNRSTETNRTGSPNSYRSKGNYLRRHAFQTPTTPHTAQTPSALKDPGGRSSSYLDHPGLKGQDNPMIKGSHGTNLFRNEGVFSFLNFFKSAVPHRTSHTKRGDHYPSPGYKTDRPTYAAESVVRTRDKGGVRPGYVQANKGYLENSHHASSKPSLVDKVLNISDGGMQSSSILGNASRNETMDNQNGTAERQEEDKSNESPDARTMQTYNSSSVIYNKLTKKDGTFHPGHFPYHSMRGHILNYTASNGSDDLSTFATMYLLSLQKVSANRNMSTSHAADHASEFQLIWGRVVNAFCARKTINDCDPVSPYRTIDGSCNNLDHPEWGQSLQPQRRLLPPAYDDVLNYPRTLGRDGTPLPSTRVLSNILFKTDQPPRHHTTHTVMVMAWGQFVDHDMVNTPQVTNSDGSKINCCSDEERRSPRDECFPIQIPEDDDFFVNKTCMNFVRSAPADTCVPAIREQMNTVTSYIDASNVYGSTEGELQELREGSRGLLKVSNGDLPPKWTDNNCNIVDSHKGIFCMLAGDKRVNVVPNLSALHIAFIREHNRIAKRLAEINPHWSRDDVRLFEEARKIVGAYMQLITYKEYLPTVLNKETMQKYNLNIDLEEFTNQYNPERNAGLANVFGVAAFRFGHSQISNHQAFVNEEGNFSKVLPIEDCYHNPAMLEEDACSTGCPKIVRWMTTDTCTVADRAFEAGVRDKLFMDKTGQSLDLPALNIQRGRDHGMAPYVTWRKWLGLSDVTHFDPNKNGGLIDHDQESAALLKRAYSHVEDIDLYAGAMLERHLPGASVGPVFALLIARQFQALREGDRFWFENGHFTKDQLQSIMNVKLARILCENMNVEFIQQDVMSVPNKGSNIIQKCDDMDSLNLELWKE